MVDVLAALDDTQRSAAELLIGPVSVLAGAGTGKTRVLTHRIAHGLLSGTYPEQSVLALTFTTKAAAELRDRLRALGTTGAIARTFHAEALAQLNFFWPDLVGGSSPRILENKARLIAEAADTLNITLSTAALREIATEIEWRKTAEVSLADYPGAAASRPMPRGLDADAVAAIQVAYEGLKDDRRRLDFEDVLVLAAGMLDSEPRALDTVRSKYRYFVVDEYQDVSPLQQRLLELWLGDRRDLCVVGDASQTIYSFTGASNAYLLNFGARFPDATEVRLEQNYRSTPQVLNAANTLMRGRPGALTLRARATSRETVPDPTVYDTDEAEAVGVADAIVGELASGTRPEQIAILYRVNEQAAAFSTALRARGIPTRQLGTTKFFELPAIRRLTSALSVHAQRFPDDDLRKTVSDMAREAGWLLKLSDARAGRPDSRITFDEWAALDALVRFAESAPETVTLGRFVAELDERESTRNELPASSVVLSTLHGAKGLEWESVHLVGLSEGLLPVSHARGLAAIDEERRLLYVGITRARRRLALSWARGGARAQNREPSRFLAELRTNTPDAPSAATR